MIWGPGFLTKLLTSFLSKQLSTERILSKYINNNNLYLPNKWQTSVKEKHKKLNLTKKTQLFELWRLHRPYPPTHPHTHTLRSDWPDGINSIRILMTCGKPRQRITRVVRQLPAVKPFCVKLADYSVQRINPTLIETWWSRVHIGRRSIPLKRSTYNEGYRAKFGNSKC